MFSDLADCWDGNTDEAFCVFATSLAGTRAEGRALRKALGVKVATAEEVTKKDTAKVTRDLNSRKESTDGGYDEGDRMTDPQANFIDVKCGKKKGGLNTDVTAFFKQILNIDVKRKITKAQASDAIEKLNEYQAAGLPSELTLPYSSDWRN